MKRSALLAAAVLLFARPEAAARGAEPTPDTGTEPLVRAMKDELARSASELHLPDTPKPYYLALRVSDTAYTAVNAEFGAVVFKHTSHHRVLHVDIRVGDYDLDNSNFGGDFPDFTTGGMEELPLDDDYDVIRHDIWSASDRAYKGAAATYAKKQASLKTQADSKDHVGDFSREAPSHIVARRPLTLMDVDEAALLAKELSALARTYRELQASDVNVYGAAGRQIFLSSEGSATDERDSVVVLTATLRTQAPDGMQLSRVVSFAGASLRSLPARDVIERDIAAAAADLTRQRLAPEAEDYVGPVLFEPRAAAQLVRDLLAPELSGAPAPKTDAASPAFRGMAGSETELSGKIDQRVMSAGLRVEDDPTIDHYAGLPLVGGYSADDEGMAGQKVVVIENGILKRFLMSRAPRKGSPHSNGHARAGMMGSPKGGISNLVVSAPAASRASAAALRRALLAEAKAAGRSYAIIVRELDDAGASGNRFAAFLRRSRGSSVSAPLVVVKVKLDGTEEPIRGATFGALPLRDLEEIIAIGTDAAVVSQGLGNTSSVVSPALLIKRVELKKPSGPQRKPPALGHPFFATSPPG